MAVEGEIGAKRFRKKDLLNLLTGYAGALLAQAECQQWDSKVDSGDHKNRTLNIQMCRAVTQVKSNSMSRTQIVALRTRSLGAPASCDRAGEDPAVAAPQHPLPLLPRLPLPHCQLLPLQLQRR